MCLEAPFAQSSDEETNASISEALSKLLALAESRAFSDIHIDLQMITIQVCCLPQVVRERPGLIEKVFRYFQDELINQNDSELRQCVLYAIIQSGRVDAILEALPDLQMLSTYYPPRSEVAQGLQTLHLQVRERIRHSFTTVVQELMRTNSSEQEKVALLYQRILSMYPD